MVEIGYHDDVVSIGDEKVELPEPVVNVVRTDDAVLVHCEEGSMGPRNLVAYDYDGNELWQIQPLKKDEDDQAYPVDGVSKGKNGVQVYSWGERYRLDPKTGSVDYLGWVR